MAGIWELAGHPQDEWAARAIADLGDHISLGLAKGILARRHPETARAWRRSDT